MKKNSPPINLTIFNIFISAPQVLVCTLLAWFIDVATYNMAGGFTNNHWDYAFMFGAIMLVIASFIALSTKEE